MFLQEGIIGREYQVEGVDLPLQLERRLAALGIIGGTRIKVLNRKSHGALVVFVRGSRFAIGAGIAANVKIREVAE